MPRLLIAKKRAIHDEGRRLPDDFVDHVTRMIRVHISAGNWVRAVDAVAAAERMWLDRAEELSDPASDPNVMARHVSCLRLDARTVSQIDEACYGTIGALLEIFPDHFIATPGIGVQTIKTIAAELCRIGAISQASANVCVRRFTDRRREWGSER